MWLKSYLFLYLLYLIHDLQITTPPAQHFSYSQPLLHLLSKQAPDPHFSTHAFHSVTLRHPTLSHSTSTLSLSSLQVFPHSVLSIGSVPQLVPHITPICPPHSPQVVPHITPLCPPHRLCPISQTPYSSGLKL